MAGAGGPLGGGLGLLAPHLPEVPGDADGVGGGAGEAAAGEAHGVEPGLTLPPVGEGGGGVPVLAEEVGALEPLWNVAAVAGGHHHGVEVEGSAVGELGPALGEPGDSGHDGDVAGPDRSIIVETTMYKFLYYSGLEVCCFWLVLAPVGIHVALGNLTHTHGIQQVV